MIWVTARTTLGTTSLQESPLFLTAMMSQTVLATVLDTS